MQGDRAIGRQCGNRMRRSQPSLLDLENLLASQKALVKQLKEITVKQEEEEKALYTNRCGGSSRSPHRPWFFVREGGNKGDCSCELRSCYCGEA